MEMFEYLIASCTNELPCLPGQRCLRDKMSRRNGARNPVFYFAYIARLREGRHNSKICVLELSILSYAVFHADSFGNIVTSIA